MCRLGRGGIKNFILDMLNLACPLAIQIEMYSKTLKFWGEIQRHKLIGQWYLKPQN